MKEEIKRFEDVSLRVMVRIYHLYDIMDRFMYLDSLQNIMLSYAEEEMSLQWRLQQDSDPRHISKECIELLNNKEFLNWSAQYPDLNPTEHQGI